MGIEKTLKRAEVFLGLADSDLSKIVALPSCREESYQPGDILFKIDDEARYLYVLKEGQIDLVVEIPQRAQQASSEVVIDKITTGSFFGWSALVGPHYRTMSAVCKEPSAVVIISGAELLSLFEKENHIGYKVLLSLSRIIGTRLRDLEQVMVRGQRWPFLGRQEGLRD